jgi:L-lactate dehydrogenase complex protein LldF
MTSNLFREKINLALSDPVLQSALDGNAERRRNARQQAFASLPEGLEPMRQRAHAVRAEVISHLDQYLEQFAANAQANGMVVHHAADASQAVQIVRQVISQSGGRLIAKSKTMVGEEIHINHALEADGLQVVETDLGEYIVQLRGEPPAHIITPAVHLTRQQVGRTFEEKLGLPYTDDIPTLTAAAHSVLRQTFLSADVGISGVNFGVAENGALCLLTNEGNGRMVTTLPRLHIALMGIERLVPGMDDLALLLALLPRSATGQKLTVYTTLIHGPRRPGDVDGPQERHLVLVDNGRRRLRLSPLAESLYCIRCGACLNACPVFREIGGHAYLGAHGAYTPYPGPIGSVISAGLFGGSEFGQLARASSLCGACKEACPVDIDLPKLLLRVRAGLTAPGEFPPVTSAPSPTASPQAPAPGTPAANTAPRSLALGLRLFTWVAVSPRRYAAAQRLAGLFSRLLAPRSPWLRLPAMTGWGYSRDFPRPATRPFSSRFKQANSQQLARWANGPTASSRQPAADSQHSIADGQPPAANRQPPTYNQSDLVERFAAEVVALGGTFVRCPESELAGRIAALLQSQGVSAVQAWDPGELPPGLLDRLQSAGIRASLEPDPDLSAGLTGAAAGVAETGSLLLPGGAGRPLTASLLPTLHIAVLKASDILPSLAHLFAARPDLRQTSALVLVSGPSRTADIEMALTIGVHGPSAVHIFCFD